VRLLLDTVTVLMAVQCPERLGRRALKMVKSADDVRELSAISLSEISIKAASGKLVFRRDDVLQGLDDLRLSILPFTEEHALRLFDLPLYHRDPFDRLIIAQALAEKIPVVTCDEQFRLYKSLSVIW